VGDRLRSHSARRARSDPARPAPRRASRNPRPAGSRGDPLVRPGDRAPQPDRARRGADLLVAHGDPRRERADLHFPARLPAHGRAACGLAEPGGRRDRDRRRGDAARSRRRRWVRCARRRAHGDRGRVRVRRGGLVPEAEPWRRGPGRDGGRHASRCRARAAAARCHAHPVSHTRRRRDRVDPHARRRMHRDRVRDLPLAGGDGRAGAGLARGLHRADLLDHLRRGATRRELHRLDGGRAGVDPERVLARGGRPAARTPPRCRGRE
jgi:hypothetical protein